MLPGDDNNQRPQLDLAVRLSNRNCFYLIPADGGGDDFSFHHFLLVLHLLHALEVVVEVSVSVWEGLCDSDGVIIVGRADGEGQRVVVPFGVLDLMLILEIFDAPSISEPPFPVLLLLLQRKHAGHHAVIEQRIRLPHVDDVQLHSHVFRRVCDPEVEPLSVALGINVILQD